MNKSAIIPVDNQKQTVDYRMLQNQFSNALLAVDDIVLKNYLSKLDTSILLH